MDGKSGKLNFWRTTSLIFAVLLVGVAVLNYTLAWTNPASAPPAGGAGAIPITSGGTGATSASGAISALGAATSGANSNITSLTGLTTPLSAAQGGTGISAVGASGNILTSNGTAWTSAAAGGGGNPTGTIVVYAGSTAPTGYLIADGSAVSRTTYSALFTAIGTTYGAGDGSTTFNLPNLQGRHPMGKDTGTFLTIGATGGEQTHILSINEMPSHTHSIPGPWCCNVQSGGNYAQGLNSNANSTGAAGGGLAHNVLDPYIVMIYIIKF